LSGREKNASNTSTRVREMMMSLRDDIL